MAPRPSASDVVTEHELASRATAAGQGNRTRPRQHGDLAAYQWGLTGRDRANGCRCERCVEGSRAYKRRHARERTASRGRGLVALSDVRPHVQQLLKLGWQIKQIAERAETQRNVVARIGRTGAPDGDVNRRVALAILALPLVAWDRQRRLELDRALRARAAAVTDGRWEPSRDPLAYGPDDAWMIRSACAGLDPDSMYPGRGEPLDACRALCAVCPVRDECGEAGLRERQGVWGGRSEMARRRLRRQRGISLRQDELEDEQIVDSEEATDAA